MGVLNARGLGQDASKGSLRELSIQGLLEEWAHALIRQIRRLRFLIGVLPQARPEMALQCLLPDGQIYQCIGSTTIGGVAKTVRGSSRG